jgi:hypothetical protein
VDDNGTFLNWAEAGGRGGTLSIVGRAKCTSQRLGIRVKFANEENHMREYILDVLPLHLEASLVTKNLNNKLFQPNIHYILSHMIIGIKGQTDKQPKTAQIGRLLTQRVIREQRYVGLTSKEVHGATFRTLGDNTVSNGVMTNIISKRSDAFFRYTVAARTDSLPTSANIHRWYKSAIGGCRRCD